MIYIHPQVYLIFFSGNFPRFFFFRFPPSELDSKSDRRWRRDGCTEAGDPLRQWLSRLAHGAGRFLRQDARATRELGNRWRWDVFFFFGHCEGWTKIGNGEIRCGKWKKKKGYFAIWKTWNKTFQNPRFYAYSERGINFKNYGGPRFYSWSRSSICARNWWCWPFTIDRAVTSSV